MVTDGSGVRMTIARAQWRQTYDFDGNTQGPMIRLAATVSVPLLFAGLCSERVSAQSTKDLAAFSALIVSPIGSLPPTATDNGTSIPDRATLGVSYGRWRYDIDDAIHHNVGVTVTERLGSSAASIALTGAYLSLSCECSGWASGGVSIRSMLWTSALPAPSAMSRTTVRVGLNLAAGGARYSGVGHATGVSGDGELDLGVSTMWIGGSRLALSLLPGLGIGHLSSADATATGARPLFGAAAAWRFRRGIAIDVGAERVVLRGGPTQFGAGISWHER